MHLDQVRIVVRDDPDPVPLHCVAPHPVPSTCEGASTNPGVTASRLVRPTLPGNRRSVRPGNRPSPTARCLRGSTTNPPMTNRHPPTLRRECRNAVPGDRRDRPAREKMNNYDLATNQSLSSPLPSPLIRDWRSFQIAFFVMSIPALSRRRSPFVACIGVITWLPELSMSVPSLA